MQSTCGIATPNVAVDEIGVAAVVAKKREREREREGERLVCALVRKRHRGGRRHIHTTTITYVCTSGVNPRLTPALSLFLASVSCFFIA